ncbi:MAG TPA: twin-arginine translocase subunit TatC [Streptosporangiaceae bacterium]|nr:twin-arginine translocase subunit TatC [Streptosporangiaceae bacterium]
MATRPGALAGARIAGERFVRSRRQQNPEGRMPLLEHLRELRNRVVKMALGLAAGMVVGFVFFNQAWHVIERPLCSAVIRGQAGCNTLGVNQLVLNGPLDSFYLRVKIALIVGVIVSSPVWLYQIWAFVAPGLYAREKRWSYLFLGTAVPLFLIGITLAYWSLGRSMHYLLGLTPQHVSNLIQVDQYMSFVMTMMLAFGIAFEVPLLIIMLNLAGVLTHERFRKWRRVLIFGVFLIAGLANPSPDPLTMLFLGGACAALVEVAEFIVWSHDRRRARLHPSPYEGLADDELSPLDLDDTDTHDGSLN